MGRDGHPGPGAQDRGPTAAKHDRGFTLQRAGPRRYRLTAPDGRTWTSHITATGITVTANFRPAARV